MTTVGYGDITPSTICKHSAPLLNSINSIIIIFSLLLYVINSFIGDDRGEAVHHSGCIAFNECVCVHILVDKRDHEERRVTETQL